MLSFIIYISNINRTVLEILGFLLADSIYYQPTRQKYLFNFRLLAVNDIRH